MSFLYAIVLYMWSYAVGWLVVDKLILRGKSTSLGGFFLFLMRPAVGIGVSGYVAFLLLTLGFFPPWLATTIMAIGALVGVVALRSTWRDARLPGWDSRNPVEWIGLLCFLAPAGLGAFATWTPSLGIDAYMYHIPVPKQWLIQGSLRGFPFNAMSNYHMLTDLWNVWPLSFDSDNFLLTKLKEYYSGLAIALLLALALRSKFGAGAGWFAATAWMLYREILRHGASNWIDLSHAVFVVMALLVVARTFEPTVARRRLFLLAGVLFGFAIGTKLTGYLMLGYAGSAWLLLSLFRASIRRRPMHLLRCAILVIIPALLMALPWLAKNVILTGNPVPPLLTNVFPVNSQYAGAVEDFRQYHKLDEPIDWSTKAAHAKLFFRNTRYLEYPRLLTAASLALLLLIARRKGTPRSLGFIAVLVALMLPQLLFIEQERFVYGPSAMMLLLAAWVAASLLHSAREPRRAIIAWIAVAVSLFCFYNSFRTLWNHAFPVLPGRQPYPYSLLLTRHQMEEDFFSKLPEWEFVLEAERLLGPDDLLLNTELGFHAALIDVPMLPNPTHHDRSTYQHLRNLGLDARQMRDALTELGVTHVLSRFPEPDPEIQIFRQRYLEPLITRDGLVIYQVRTYNE